MGLEPYPQFPSERRAIRLSLNDMPFKNPNEKKAYQDDYDNRRRQTHRAIKLTLTLDEYRRFERFAKTERHSIPKTLTALASAKLDDAPFVPNDIKEKLAEIVRLLRASGNNVNQIAHACNVQAGFMGESKTPEEGIQILTQIHEGLVQIEVMISQKLNLNDH